MADLNKVFLMGRLTFDPELRRTPTGTAVTELRMATTRTWSGRDGERREETLFIDVTVWDRQAENCCQYPAERQLDPRRRFTQDGHLGRQDTGEKRSKIRVHADRVQFLDSPPIGGAGGRAARAWTTSWRPPARDRACAAAVRRPRGPAAATASRAGRPTGRPGALSAAGPAGHPPTRRRAR